MNRGEHISMILLLLCILSFRWCGFALSRRHQPIGELASQLPEPVEKPVWKPAVVEARKPSADWKASERGQTEPARASLSQKREDKPSQPEPYRQEKPSRSRDSLPHERANNPPLPKTYEPLDLNAADTSQLVRLPGIGVYTAEKILSYRERLGGFSHLEQLDEINGIRVENLSVLKELAFVDSSLIRHIDLNAASVEQLMSHPYLSFYQAKAVASLRRARPNGLEASDLQFLEEFSPDDLRRLRPYL